MAVTPEPGRTTYQWLRGGRAIKGATRATYRVARSDAGHRIKVTVTVHARGYEDGTATSQAKKVRRIKRR